MAVRAAAKKIMRPLLGLHSRACGLAMEDLQLNMLQRLSVLLTGRVRGHSTSATAGKGPRFTVENASADVVKASYAVRGPVLDLAMALQKRLGAGEKLPFTELVHCNIGNPQNLKQQPLTFIRNVLSLIVNPALLEAHADLFPSDVVARARAYLAQQPMGAYSNSQGLKLARDEVAAFIGARDGYPSDPEQIFLTNGASEGVRFVMQTLLRTKAAGFNDGVLVPIPQYPLYSALTTLLNGNLVPYYLHEESGWGLEPDELKRALEDARSKGITVRGLVVINPGNPTGQVLSRDNVESIIKLCAAENLVLMADEVYQTNIWRDDTEFISFRQVALELGHEQKSSAASNLQLVSFHSVSKGFLGECGLRGGYFELFGIDDGIKAELYKLASISLCSNTVGQVVTGLMVNPPKAGDPSFDQYEKEKNDILSSLKRRARTVTSSLAALEGVSVQPSDGALYSFPQITLPAKFVAEAESHKKAADLWYAMKLLDETGIVVVPGSGFGQREGTYHFRTTILPPEEKMDGVTARLSAFHKKLMDDYRS